MAAFVSFSATVTFILTGSAVRAVALSNPLINQFVGQLVLACPPHRPG